MRNNKTFFLKIASVCLSLFISSYGFSSRDKGKEKEAVSDEEELACPPTSSWNNTRLEEEQEEAYASEEVSSEASDFMPRKYNSTYKKSQQNAGKTNRPEKIRQSIYYSLPTNISLFLARNSDPMNSSTLYIPARVEGIVTANSQSTRVQLAQLIDFRFEIQKLKSEILRLTQENEIKKAILKHRTGPTSWGTSLLNSWVGRDEKENSEKINKDKVESELPLEVKASLVHRTLPLVRASSERRDFKNSSPNLHKNKPSGSSLFVLKQMKAVCKEMNTHFKTGLITPNPDLLLHHYIHAETLFSVESLNAKIENLIVEYQGFTKEEQERSLLSQYQAALGESVELEASLKKYQLQPESRYLEVSPIRPIATQVILKLSNLEDEVNPLKEFNLIEVKSLSLWGPKLSLATAISLSKNFLPQMENLKHLSLESEISEAGAVEKILSALVKPLKSLKIAPPRNDAVLQEIQKALNLEALESFIILGHPQPPKQQVRQAVTQEGIQALLFMLSKASQLVQLDVHNLPLSQRIKQFSKALSAHIFLESLNLGGININGSMLDSLITSLHPSRLAAMKIIDVRDNPDLTIYDILCLEKIFPKSTVLTSNNLEEKLIAMARLQRMDMQNICLENIEEKVQELKHLNLSEVRSLLLTGEIFNQQLASLLYTSLLRMINLTKLSLKFHQFDPVVVGKTLNWIPHTLTSLTLGPNFDHRHFGEIEGNGKLKGLKELILPSYPQGHDYMQHLGIILWQTPHLLTLDVRANFNIACALKEFGMALKVLSHLSTLKLTMRGLRSWDDLKHFITNDISETLKEGNLEIDLRDVDIKDSAKDILAQVQFLRNTLPKAQILYTAPKIVPEEEREITEDFIVLDNPTHIRCSAAQPTMLYLNPTPDKQIETQDASIKREKPSTEVGCSGSLSIQQISSFPNEEIFADISLSTETEEEEGWVFSTQKNQE
ncbi:MAG: hypothetical protein IBJ00_01400 [Alphaproteobacteria bacterium]|nr:hypothetical protein [Alphaproteobacteria bacterium]